MSVFKKYIAVLLLAGFLFPQAANSMHYFLFPHKISNHGKSLKYQVPSYEFHHCHLNLHSLTYLLPLSNEFKKQIDQNHAVVQNFYYSLDHTVELAFNYRLRGPPAGL